MTEQVPADELVEWAMNYVHDAWDRPWFYEEPPIFLIEHYQPPCRCQKSVKLHKYECSDGKGFVYLGQCKSCEAIIWSFKEQ